MDIAQKTLQLKQDFDDVYEAGKKAEYDAFWDGMQDYGNRQNYDRAFRNWSGTKIIKPKHAVITNTLYEIFANCNEVEEIPTVALAQNKTAFDTCYNAFNNCYKLKSIDFDIANGAVASSAWDATFNYCYELKTIKKIVVLESQVFKLSTFRSCEALENLTIEGTIGQNGFDIHWSTKLSADSLASVVNALSATTTGLTITLPTTAQANYEAVYGEGSWDELTATRSNWTIAYA